MKNETSKNETAITAYDAHRFRMALLRAKLTRMSVVFDAEADEIMLERQLRFAERQVRERADKALQQKENGQSMGMQIDTSEQAAGSEQTDPQHTHKRASIKGGV